MVLGYFRLRRIIPTHLKTQPAATKEEARTKVLSLYRTCLRQAAEIQSLYPLDIPVLQIRQRMRQEFEKNKYTTELDAINYLTFQAAAELEETLYMWKTQSHVMKYFTRSEDATRQHQLKSSGNFLDSFYAGK